MTPVEDTGSFVLRFGTAVGLSVVASLASAFPAAVRVSSYVNGPDGAMGHVWLALAAVALVPMLPAVIVLRGARVGLRTFVGEGAELRGYGVGLWLGSLFVSLAMFGSVLRKTTHQHALAGVTFAAGAVVLALGTGLVCARVVTILRNASPRGRAALATVLGLMLLSAVAWTGLAFLRAVSRDPASVAASGTIVDTLAFLLAALFASRSPFRAAAAPRRVLALIGPPIAVVVAALGSSALTDGSLRAAMDERAPAFAPALDLVGKP
jgi:hypothetical protein